MNRGNNFHESFEQFGGLGLSSRSFSIYQPGPVFYFFEKVHNEIIKGPGTSFQIKENPLITYQGLLYRKK